MSQPEYPNLPTIGITGAAGSLAADIIPGLIDAGYHIIGIDHTTPDKEFGCTWKICSINDRSALTEALRECDAIIHLAGIPLEADWDDLMRANIDGTQAVLEVARLENIDRVILASSIHATGFTGLPHHGQTVADDAPMRPNTFYGVSKVAMEALGSLYHDRFGLEVICLRIASRFDQPRDERMLSTWLSPKDAVRLMVACLTTISPNFQIVWGVSSNTRSYFSQLGGQKIGYEPQDDAEVFSDEILETKLSDSAQTSIPWNNKYIGGVFSSPHPPRMSAT